MRGYVGESATGAKPVGRARAEKALYRRFGLATGCFTAMLAVTLVGNMPINVAVLRSREPGDPARWTQLRRRWDRIHTVRVLLDAAGSGLLVAARVTS